MKIGDHYDIVRVTLRDWQKLARACSVPEEHVMTMLANMTHELPDHVSAACDQAITGGLDKSVVVSLADQLNARVKDRSNVVTVR